MDRISPTLKSTGVGHFGPKFRGLPLGVWCLGSAVSEHPRLTNHEIISEEFQPVWSQSTNVSDGQTGSETDDMRSQDRALHLHRAVKKWKFKSWYAAEKVLPDWQVNLLEMSSLYSHTKAMTLTPLFDCVVNHAGPAVPFLNLWMLADSGWVQCPSFGHRLTSPFAKNFNNQHIILK